MKFPYIASIPMVQVKDHAPTNDIEIYGNEACVPKGPRGYAVADGTKLRDTGKWGYIADKNSPCWGMLFVDCTHNDYKGTPWYSW